MKQLGETFLHIFFSTETSMAQSGLWGAIGSNQMDTSIRFG